MSISFAEWQAKRAARDSAPAELEVLLKRRRDRYAEVLAKFQERAIAFQCRSPLEQAAIELDRCESLLELANVGKLWAMRLPSEVEQLRELYRSRVHECNTESQARSERLDGFVSQCVAVGFELANDLNRPGVHIVNGADSGSRFARRDGELFLLIPQTNCIADCNFDKFTIDDFEVAA